MQVTWRRSRPAAKGVYMWARVTGLRAYGRALTFESGWQSDEAACRRVIGERITSYVKKALCAQRPGR